MLRHTNLNTFAGSDGGGWDGGKGSVLFGQVLFFHMYAVYRFPVLFTIKKHSFLFWGFPLRQVFLFHVYVACQVRLCFVLFGHPLRRGISVIICTLQSKLNFFLSYIFFVFDVLFDQVFVC